MDPPTCFEQFLQLVPEAIGLIRNLGVKAQDTEDVVQDALCSIWQRCTNDRLSIIENPRGWFFSVVRQKAIDSLMNTRQIVTNKDWVDPSVFPHEEFDRLEERTVLLMIICKLLERYPEKQRQAFIYCEIGEHTIAEAAIKVLD